MYRKNMNDKELVLCEDPWNTGCINVAIDESYTLCKECEEYYIDDELDKLIERRIGYDKFDDVMFWIIILSLPVTLIIYGIVALINWYW